jgi:methylated-DNA-protein-cysteine methyltransferase-like protein
LRKHGSGRGENTIYRMVERFSSTRLVKLVAEDKDSQKIKKMDRSNYIVTPFTEKVIDIIRNIPEGRVMTYGQIAGLAGSPRAARQVVRILHSMSKKHRLPWHRVINAKGQIALKNDESYNEQIITLRIEGVEVGLNGIIDLEKYRWQK